MALASRTPWAAPSLLVRFLPRVVCACAGMWVSCGRVSKTEREGWSAEGRLFDRARAQPTPIGARIETRLLLIGRASAVAKLAQQRVGSSRFVVGDHGCPKPKNQRHRERVAPSGLCANGRREQRPGIEHGSAFANSHSRFKRRLGCRSTTPCADEQRAVGGPQVSTDCGHEVLCGFGAM